MKSLGSHLPSTLKQRANRLRELNRHLYSILPAEFHGHIQVANLHRDLITLEADSPAWASRVRYHSNDLTRRLSVTTGLTIKSLKLRIQPAASKPGQIKRKPLTISGHSARRFESLAGAISHPDLKRALLNLSKRNQKSD
jgi:hypothetical protein